MKTTRNSRILLRYAFVVVLFSAAAFALWAATGVDLTQQAAFPEIFGVNSTGDGIRFGIPTTDPGYSNGTWTINVPRALPDITDGANISGPGADKLTVQVGGASAPLRIFNITATGTVNFFGITIARGQAPNDGSAGSGLRNLSATVNITKCAFVNDYVTAI